MKYFRSFILAPLLCGIVAILSVSTAEATTVFKYDTYYALSGSFNYGHFGKMTLGSESLLFYDSLKNELSIEANLSSNKYKGGDFDFDLLFGSAALRHASLVDGDPDFVNFHGASSKIEFSPVPGAPVKHGLKMVGTLTPDFDFNLHNIKNKKHAVPAGYDFPVFNVSMPSSISVDSKGRLTFKSWLKTWDSFPVHHDAKADPLFYLTEVARPPTEIPEPMSLVLLGTGLLCASRLRRSEDKNKIA